MPTDKYNLHTIDYSVQGWDAIMTADMEMLDAVIHTCLIVTLGEEGAAHEAVYIGADGKACLARADGAKMPAIGLLVEGGIADDEVRVQRVGPITDEAWSWTPGQPVYLSPDTAGALTQEEPDINQQIAGIAYNATTILAGAGMAIPPSIMALFATARVQTLTCADNVTVDWSLGGTAEIALDRATTTLAFTGALNGQRCVLIVKQYAGIGAVAFGAEVRAGADPASPPALTATAGKKDYLGYIYNGTDGKYDFVSITKGF